MKNKAEKRSVGRPKLADLSLKKKSLIISIIMLVLTIVMFFGALVSLNILKLNRLKGETTSAMCAIPDEFKPGGLHDYGFTDPYFYSEIVKKIKGNDPAYCNDLTENDLNNLTKLEFQSGDYYSEIKMSLDGYQYLKNMKILDIYYYVIEEVNIKNMPNLEEIGITSNGEIKYVDIENLQNLNYFYVLKSGDGSNINFDDLKLVNLPSLEEFQGDSSISPYFSINNHKAKSMTIDNVPLPVYLENRRSIENIAVKNVPGFFYMSVGGYSGQSDIKSLVLENISDAQIKTELIYNKKLYLKNVNFNSNSIITLNRDMEDIEISNITGIKKLVLNDFDKNIYDYYDFNEEVTDITINGNSKIDYLNFSSFNNLKGLFIYNNSNITNLNIPNTIEQLTIANSSVKNLDVNNNTNLKYLYLMDTIIDHLDLSSNNHLSGIGLYDNYINNIYIQRGNKLNIDDVLKLNSEYNITYIVGDENILSSDLKANMVGVTNISMKSDNVDGQTIKHSDVFPGYSTSGKSTDFILKSNVIVYDVTSDVYKIDNKDKIINLEGKYKDIDVNKIDLGYEPLNGELVNNKFVIKSGERVIDTYTLVNVKKDSIKTTTTKVNDSTTTKKKVYNKTTTTTNSRSDIYLNGDNITKEVLENIKGTDKNIILDNKSFKFIINGKDIDNIDDIDLSSVIKSLDDSLLKGKIDLKDGVVVEFNKNDNIPKIKVELNVTSDILRHIGKDNISIYRYDNDLIKIAELLKVNDNKLTFTIDKLGTYVISNNKVVNKVIDDTKMIKENNNNKSRYIFILLPILLLAAIGYISYNKNKKNTE